MSLQDFAVTGVYAAVLTPQNPDRSIHFEKAAAHCNWLLANGCHGLGILGTTGEANSFSVKERVELLEKLAEAGVPTQPMMPGTGCCAIPESVELTKKAIEVGAGSVLMLPPFYYKGQSDDGLFAAFAEVIERVGDERLKVLLYHFPQMSNVPLSIDLMARLKTAYPDTIVGMKDSSGVLENMTTAAREIPDFAVMSGADDLMLPVLKAGGAGCITACANVGAHFNQAVYDAFARGDVAAAEAAMPPVQALRDLISKNPLIPSLKALMARHTGDEIWATMRPPVMPMDKAAKDALFAAYDAAGLTMAAAA